MFPFRKNTELLETVEKQNVQLQRYENRLRDLVTAYRSLQNEKKALEASVKALSAGHSASVQQALGKQKSNVKGSSKESSPRSSIDASKVATSKHDTEEETEADGAEEDSCKNEEQDEANLLGSNEVHHSDATDNSEVESLRHQISTLTASLSTFSVEKSKIVATYQAERRKMKLEMDSQVAAFKDELDTLQAKKSEFEEELLQVKEKLRGEQEDREQEQSTHSLMLREIQKMLNDERTKNDQLGHDLQEARKSVQKMESENKKFENNEKQSQKLAQEINILKGKLKSAKDDAKKPQPMVEKLQREIAEIKAANRIQLEKEHLHYLNSDERLKKTEKEGEERVSALEEQITSLSNQIGTYESSKNRNQKHIRTLKERIAQLEVENGVLAKQAASATEFTRGDIDDVENLKHQIIKYKGLLKSAVQKDAIALDVDSWIADMNGKMTDDEYQKLYIETQHELQQLRDEFDKYKVRAQSVLKTKREGVMSKENAALIATQQHYQELKDELEEVRERHFHLRSHCDSLEEEQRKLMKDHGEELMRRHLEHQKELDAEKENYASKIFDLEQEMRSQRERTVALLAEKDKEIQHLQAYSDACHREYQNEYTNCSTDRMSKSSVNSDYVFHGTENSKDPVINDSVADLMAKGNQDTTAMIHYAEQMARKDISINGLRRQKKQLELQIRQLQDAIMTKDDKYSKEIASLKENISSFNRTKSRANANLDYLKNVMYQYLTTDKDQSARNRMLSAVTAILQFSPEEIKKVGRR